VQRYFKFSDHEKGIPSLGLGTWKSKPNEVGNAVRIALKLRSKRGQGWLYSHLDLASRYLNQDEIGAALHDIFSSQGRMRTDIFITSKLWNTNHHPSDVRKEAKLTLGQLQLGYLDLYLIHWPVALARREWPRNNDEGTPPQSSNLDQKRCDYSNVAWVCDGDALDPTVTLEETWEAMESLVDDGLVKHIGVSNFNIERLERILKVARIKPAVNQVLSAFHVHI
jgi:diketogulonate reductase-like aldo/keto reductase